ncbi:unnamed protein product [Pseudo-nitzschia multistriata]|uniref:Uncharacterized protein n=1 Tax=Pseudo-nitzschia multistriata TaxID=183589 RepID=A0A448YZX0_9STRA|nr:unnamed protein product [Pseudo-nitzschia multistriata]
MALSCSAAPIVRPLLAGAARWTLFRASAPAPFRWAGRAAAPSANPPAGFAPGQWPQTARSFASFLPPDPKGSSLCPKKVTARLNEFQDLFVEARLCIDDAKDSVGTVYFEEDSEEAREAVEAAIECFETLVGEISDADEKNRVLRSNGLKVEQLRGELEMTLGEHDDHH